MSGFWNVASAVLEKVSASARSRFCGGPIGTLGDITFEVAAYNKIHTIDGFSHETKARLTSHEVIGNKPITEFLGPDTASISFEIKLHVAWGVNPTTEYKKLVEYCETGEVLQFVLGNKPVGENKWIIESLSESVEIFDTDGSILYSKVKVSLQEYIENEVTSSASN